MAELDRVDSGLVSTPRKCDINKMASEVFDILAKGGDAMSLDDFQRCSTVLAQLSDDFAKAPMEVFERIDQNRDSLVQRGEFVNEVQNIAELVGGRKVVAAIEDVRAVAEKFRQEAALAESQLATNRSTARSRPSSGRPVSSRRPSADPPMELDIRPKPLHRRGPRDKLQSIRAREKVLENMVQYFKTLRADYEDKLERIKGEHKDLLGEAEAGALDVPPVPRIFGMVQARPAREPVEGRTATDGSGAEAEIEAGAVEGDEDFAKPDLEDEPDEEEEEDDDTDEANESDAEEEEDDEDEEEDDDEEDEEEEEEKEDETAEEADAGSPKSSKSKDDITAAAEPTETTASESKDMHDSPPGAVGAGADVTAASTPVPTEGADPTADASAAPEDALEEAPEPAEATGVAGPKKKKKKKAAKRKAAEKAERKPGRSPRPDAAANATRRSPRPSDEAVEAALEDRGEKAPPASARPAKAKGRGKLDEEGVQCVQELNMGLAIRSAVCLGREVWCADWKGNVTIRERDDASKVKAEIPTNRFVMCMAHMAPSMLWMGQEAQGISVFNAAKKRFETVLTGGHTGGVFCLALDEALGDEVDGEFPVRRGWSGSNDFTIRQWWIETFLSKRPPPERVRSNPGSVVVNLGRLSVGICRGLQMHGHTNGVRVLLRIGPHIWSGSDDGTIRIWNSADGSCTEVIEDAHNGSVLKLSVVRSYVWSCGADGLIKEWQIGGDIASRCLRQVAPPGFEKGAYAIVPLGKDVWSCGHHPNIQVLSQVEMEKHMEYPAHEPYISTLLAVDRIETRILWSTSLADRKLKVWRHTVRGNVPNVDELKAANKLYEDEEQGRAERMAKLVEEADALRAQIEIGGEEYKSQLDGLAQELAEEKAAHEATEEQRKLLQEEMDGLRRLFEEAGLGDLLKDPEALRSFLDIKRLFDEAGLGHLLKDPEALKKFLAVGQAFNEVGLGKLLEDPAALRDFLNRASQIEDILRSLGLEDVLRDPQKLKEMLQSFLSLKEMLEKYGFGDAVRDPSILAEILSRYTGLKAAFEEQKFSELFEDPYTLKGFLRNYARIREEFRNVDLEYLMDSAPAMRDFLAQHGQNQTELKELRLLAGKLELVEKTLSKTKSELADAVSELESLRAKLKEFTDLCPDVATLQKWKDEALQYRGVLKKKKEAESELEEMRRLLDEKEQERLDALERERLMAMKYKELDIFKLDIIARELKKLDNELGMVGKSVKALQTDTGRLRNYDEREQITPHGDKMMDQCKDLRAHIHDVINKCLSETQKMHIGVAIDDPTAAGELKDGGVMAGYVLEEVEVPDYGSSKAAKLRHGDEVRRERETKRSPARSPARSASPELT